MRTAQRNRAATHGIDDDAHAFVSGATVSRDAKSGTERRPQRFHRLSTLRCDRQTAEALQPTHHTDWRMTMRLPTKNSRRRACCGSTPALRRPRCGGAALAIAGAQQRRCRARSSRCSIAAGIAARWIGPALRASLPARSSVVRSRVARYNDGYYAYGAAPGYGLLRLWCGSRILRARSTGYSLPAAPQYGSCTGDRDRRQRATQAGPAGST